jgi:glycosyltransferase involved in cell wall biosynthesis
MSVSVIIPAFNEEKSIKEVVKRTILMLNKNNYHGEVIVIDDGSKDNTWEICKQLSKEHPQTVKVLHNRINKGKTEAIKRGFEASTGNFVVMIDADLQYDPFDIPLLLRALLNENADVACGYRVNRRDRFDRKIYSYFFNLYSRLLFGLPVHDVNCGLKAYKGDLLHSINLSPSRWFVDVELLAKLHRGGKKIIEVPISHSLRAKGKSKISFFNITYESIKNGLSLKLKMLKDGEGG